MPPPHRRFRSRGHPAPLEVAVFGWCVGDAYAESLEAVLIDIFDNPGSVALKESKTVGWAKLLDMYNWCSIGRLTRNVYREVLGRKR